MVRSTQPDDNEEDNARSERDNSKGDLVQGDPPANPSRPGRPRVIKAMWDLKYLWQWWHLHKICMSNAPCSLQSIMRMLKVISCTVITGCIPKELG